MNRWLILLAAGASLALSSGCATTPIPDPWATLEASAEPAQQPLRLPEWPQEASSTDHSVTFDLEGARAISAYIATAEGNTAIALEHAAQIDALNQAAAALIEAGMAQRKVADLRLEILQEERRHNVIEKIGLYAMMIAALGIAAL